MVDTERKKDERRRAYNASGSITKCPFLNARIIKEIEWLPCSSVMAYYHLIGYFKGFGAVRNAQERGRDAIIHKGKTVTGIRWLDLSHWVSHWDKLAIEVVKMEYANAQLECSAADERAKILASEVIGLEEKALRLRSSELKLERQLENSTAEINYYPGKLVV